MYCLCVNVYCHRVATQLQLINISYHISYVTQGSLTKCQELYKNSLTIQPVCSSQEWFYTCHSYEYLSTTVMFHYLAHCHIIVGLDVFASAFYTPSSHVPFTVLSATPPKPSVLILKCHFTWQHVHMRVHTCMHIHTYTCSTGFNSQGCASLHGVEFFLTNYKQFLS